MRKAEREGERGGEWEQPLVMVVVLDVLAHKKLMAAKSEETSGFLCSRMRRARASLKLTSPCRVRQLEAASSVDAT